jgi:hypothetical protein
MSSWSIALLWLNIIKTLKTQEEEHKKELEDLKKKMPNKVMRGCDEDYGYNRAIDDVQKIFNKHINSK